MSPKAEPQYNEPDNMDEYDQDNPNRAIDHINGDASGNKRKKTFEMVVSILSIAITFGLLYGLALKAEQFTKGDRSTRTIVQILIYALALLFSPLLFKFKNLAPSPSKIAKQQKKEQKMKYFIKKVKLDSEYHAHYVQKCPKCGFDNTQHTKTCFNCGYQFY